MKYIDYYPPVLQEVYEIKLIALIFDKFLAAVESNKEQLQNELYLGTAKGSGLEIWERILGLPVTDTDIEVRRFKIRSKLLGDSTSLRTKLNALLGEDKYKITVYPNDCHILFSLELSAQNLKSEIIELLEKVLPVNLTYEVDLAYNRHIDLKPYTYNELKKYTHKELNAKKL
ncbi:MAG: DUF2313 domain-containing protein [Clostridia bacterium]|nr:DUF2313 domain-containing protein [Clostridia bacterium]